MCVVSRDKELNIRDTAFGECTEHPGQRCSKNASRKHVGKIQISSNGWIVLETLFSIKNGLECML